MLPPCPPSPPAGPPFGTYFSRRHATMPSPPSPPATEISASSMNCTSSAAYRKGAKRPQTPPWYRASGGRHDGNLLAIAAAAELDGAVDEGEKRVVAPDPHVRTGIKARAALAHQDVARDDPLASEALHAQPLGVGIPPVAGRAGPLFRGKELEVEVKHSWPIVAKPAQNATRFRSGGWPSK